MITVVDSGLGNIQSVVNMIDRAGGACKVAREPGLIADSEKILLPGVGAFDRGVTALRERGLDVALRVAVENGARLLGICLGMQLLLESSEEGKLPGLGLVPGRVRKFRFERQELKVPHMGWNIAYPTKPSQLFPRTDERRFYFVHSYHVECRDLDDVTAISRYGIQFTCAIERLNVFGVQFHPEKSHRFGMELLKRFIEI